MSLPLQLSELQRPLSGVSLLLTGAETDLARALLVTLLTEDWPVAAIHLLFARRRRGPAAVRRFRAFCRHAALARPLRDRFGPHPDTALAGRVFVHEGAPAKDDLGLGETAASALAAECGAVIIAARSRRPDGDPAIALAREVRHPRVVQRRFPSAAVVLVSDAGAISDAAAGGRPIAEADAPRHFNPEIETIRLVRGLDGAVADRRAAAFTRARTLGFPSIRGYAAGIGEALFLARRREGDASTRQLVVRLGTLGPAEAGALVGVPLDAGPLDALHALLNLPLRHLPLSGDGQLQLTPIDRAARLVLLGLSRCVAGIAPPVLNAMPAPEADLTTARAVALGQLALRRAPADANPLRAALRRWVVATPDPAGAAAGVTTARRTLAAAQVLLGSPRGEAQAHALGALLEAGRGFLAATTANLDAELGRATALVDRWLPLRPVVFETRTLEALLTAGGFGDASDWARLATPVDWRAWWLTSGMPASVAGAARFERLLARRAAGPDAVAPKSRRPEGLAPVAKAAMKLGVQIISRLERR